MEVFHDTAMERHLPYGITQNTKNEADEMRSGK